MARQFVNASSQYGITNIAMARGAAAIRAADGTLRVVGDTGPVWWDTSRPADPEPGTPRTKPVAIYCADCRATSEPTP